MATLADPVAAGKMNFPGPIGTKRRRMRSGGNVSTITNNTPKQTSSIENISEEKTTQTSKCKGATTIPIFLKMDDVQLELDTVSHKHLVLTGYIQTETYKMIDTCDPNIASWTSEGDMFVVKDPDVFAEQVIPQYFDHNKFSSFARQLNFYGFRKMQSKPIRNSDYDAGTAKHVTFYNENFKRGRCDLLKKIQRSTRGGGPNVTQDQQREVQLLRDQVSNLEQTITELETKFEERVRRLEGDMVNRMEQMIMAFQQQQQLQLQLQKGVSVGSNAGAGPLSVASNVPSNWDPTSYVYPRGNSVNSSANASSSTSSGQGGFQQPVAPVPPAAPTLPPHPKQKQLPPSGLPGAMSAPPTRLNSLRGISTLSRGISGLTRGQSVESSASAVLLRNSWEDKFFSMLMLDDQGGIVDPTGMVAPTPIAPGVASQQALPVQSNPVQASNSVLVSDRSMELSHELAPHDTNADDLSSVSSSDMP